MTSDVLWSIVDNARWNLVLARRSALRHPIVSLTVILSFTLGIGSALAVFTVFDAIYLRNLPVTQPSELVQLRRTPNSQFSGSFSYPLFERLQDAAAPVVDLVSIGGLELSSFNGRANMKRAQAE
jgi:putative ABC transport system permease protein